MKVFREFIHNLDVSWIGKRFPGDLEGGERKRLIDIDSLIMPPTSDPISLLHWIRIFIRNQTMAVISPSPRGLVMMTWIQEADFHPGQKLQGIPPLVNGDLFSFSFSGDENHELVPLIS